MICVKTFLVAIELNYFIFQSTSTDKQVYADKEPTQIIHSIILKVNASFMS